MKMSSREWRNRVIHFIMILSLCLAIIAAPTATIRAASSAEYTASEIQSWLINQVESTTVSCATPTVDMSTEDEMQIDASMTILGTSIALNHVVFTFDGTTTVKIKGELSLLGKSPRFGQGGNDIECTVECQAAGTPHLSGISNINVADYWPSLSGGELDTIMDIINSAIDASGLTLGSPPGEDLSSIDVSDEKLVFRWPSGSTSLDANAVTGKLQNAMDNLVDEANNYLSTGYGDPDGKWWLRVSIAGSALTLDVQTTIFGITASVTDLDITFGDMAASFTDATVSVGSRTATFSGSADISCTDYVPGLTVTGLSAGDEYPGLRDLIADYETVLCQALSTLGSNVIGDTELTCRIATFNNIGIDGGVLKTWWHEETSSPSGGSSYYILKTDLFGMKENFHIDIAGKLLEVIEVSSSDGIYTITIPKGTICLNKNGKRLKDLTVVVDEDFPQPPENARIVGLVYEFGPDGANFDPPITLTWKYDPEVLPEEVIEENLVMAYYDQEIGQWVTLDSIVVCEKDIIRALVGHFTHFAILGYVTPPEPEQAIFSISNLSIEPSEIYPGDTVTITVSVSNFGGQPGTHTMVFKIEGEVETMRGITVTAGATKTASFTVVKDKSGIYQLEVDGLKGSFVVKEVIVPLPPPPSTPWILRHYWIILIGTVGATLLACLLWWRRRG